jgi:hypothetical protein
MTSAGPVTLSDLTAAGKLLWVYCCACGHERDLDPRDLPLPGETPVSHVSRSLRCTICGAKKANTKPELYPGGIVAMRERRP